LEANSTDLALASNQWSENSKETYKLKLKKKMPKVAAAPAANVFIDVPIAVIDIPIHVQARPYIISLS
jgi:hypothetical protein